VGAEFGDFLDRLLQAELAQDGGKGILPIAQRLEGRFPLREDEPPALDAQSRLAHQFLPFPPGPVLVDGEGVPHPLDVVRPEDLLEGFDIAARLQAEVGLAARLEDAGHGGEDQIGTLDVLQGAHRDDALEKRIGQGQRARHVCLQHDPVGSAYEVLGDEAVDGPGIRTLPGEEVHPQVDLAENPARPESVPATDVHGRPWQGRLVGEVGHLGGLEQVVPDQEILLAAKQQPFGKTGEVPLAGRRVGHRPGFGQKPVVDDPPVDQAAGSIGIKALLHGKIVTRHIPLPSMSCRFTASITSSGRRADMQCCSQVH